MVDLAPDIGVVVVDILALGGEGPVRVLHLDRTAVRDAELLLIAAVDEADVILRQCLRLPDGAAADVRIAEVFQGGQAHLRHIAATQRPALQPRRSNSGCPRRRKMAVGGVDTVQHIVQADLALGGLLLGLLVKHSVRKVPALDLFQVEQGGTVHKVHGLQFSLRLHFHLDSLLHSLFHT